MKQVEGHLLQKNYDGFMKKSKIRLPSTVDGPCGKSKFKWALWALIAGLAAVVLPIICR
jgi:hypothetical protein